MIREIRHTKAIYIFLGIHAALEWLSGLGGFIYRVDEFSHYSHGEFYFLYILAYLLSITYGMYVVLKKCKKVPVQWDWIFSVNCGIHAYRYRDAAV